MGYVIAALSNFQYTLLYLIHSFTCPASSSIWNFLATAPDVVNIEEPLPYLKQSATHKEDKH